MKSVYLFDVDGTLTPPREPMQSVFQDLFVEFCAQNSVYLISGSDRPMIEEQVPARVLERIDGLFASSGCEFWVGNRLRKRHNHVFCEEALSAMELFVISSPYPLRFGQHLARRTGMINVSVPGRNASPSERRAYCEWDRIHQEREQFAAYFANLFPDYEARIGGQISIDISPKGFNKALALEQLLLLEPKAQFVFFGDKMTPGGNDLPLAQALWDHNPANRVVSVANWRECYRLLALLMDNPEQKQRRNA